MCYTLYVSKTEYLVLSLLAAESYGLALVAASGGRLKRGSVYVLLGRLESKGLVSSRADDFAIGYSGIARRWYTLSDMGVREMRRYEAVAAAVAADY